jgi:hypothetical protein
MQKKICALSTPPLIQRQASRDRIGEKKGFPCSEALWFTNMPLRKKMKK